MVLEAGLLNSTDAETMQYMRNRMSDDRSEASHHGILKSINSHNEDSSCLSSEFETIEQSPTENFRGLRGNVVHGKHKRSIKLGLPWVAWTCLGIMFFLWNVNSNANRKDELAYENLLHSCSTHAQALRMHVLLTWQELTWLGKAFEDANVESRVSQWKLLSRGRDQPSANSVNFSPLWIERMRGESGKDPDAVDVGRVWTLRELETYTSKNDEQDERAIIRLVTNEQHVQFLGTDLHSSPLTRGALMQARDTGKLTLKFPSEPLDKDRGSWLEQLLIIYPVFKGGPSSSSTVQQRRENCLGYVVASVFMNVSNAQLSQVESVDARLSKLLAVRIRHLREKVLEKAEHDNDRKDGSVDKGANVQGSRLEKLTNDSAEDARVPQNSQFSATQADKPCVGDVNVSVSVHETQVEVQCTTEGVKEPCPWIPFAIELIGWPAFLVLSGAFIGLLLMRKIGMVEEEKKHLEQIMAGLRVAKSNAENADKAKTTFISTVSHELRTPMNGVIGMCEMLRETSLSHLQEDYVKTALTCGKAMVALISDILDFNKVEAGKMEIESVAFEVRSEMEDVVIMFAEKARKKGVHLAVLVHDAVPNWLMGDPVRLRQVLINLVGNSLKFTKEGTIMLSVRLGDVADSQGGSQERWVAMDKLWRVSQGRKGQDQGDVEGKDQEASESISKFHDVGWQAHRSTIGSTVRLICCVEDTGIGIPENVQPKLFTPFQQAMVSTSREYGGSGIGLSISDKLVSLMGGTLIGASQPGVGTVFQLDLPLQLVFPESRSSSASSSPPHPALNLLPVLVVSDCPVRQEVIASCLRQAGCRVQVKAGPAALQLAQPDREKANGEVGIGGVKLWVVDWESVGGEIARQLPGLIKSQWCFKDIGFVAIVYTLEQRSETGQAGYNGRVTSPLRTAVFHQVCADALGLRASRKSGSGSGSGSGRGGPSDLASWLQGRKVLVVDDAFINRKVAAKMLEAFGCTAVQAESGAKALDLLANEKPGTFHLVLMDCQMPEMDGYETTRRIRQMETDRCGCTVNACQHHLRRSTSLLLSSTAEETTAITNRALGKGHCSRCQLKGGQGCQVPIVAVTADVTKGTRELCLEAGMSGYLSKPLEKKMLTAVLATWLGNPKIHLPSGTQAMVSMKSTGSGATKMLTLRAPRKST